MGRWVHRVLSYDEDAGTLICAEDGVVPAYRADTGRGGVRCSVKARQTISASKRARGVPNKKVRTRKSRLKKDYCEAPGCTAVILDSVQLDVDHIDGNPRNNKISNWQTLCANCHRLKTYRPDLFANAKK